MCLIPIVRPFSWSKYRVMVGVTGQRGMRTSPKYLLLLLVCPGVHASPAYILYSFYKNYDINHWSIFPLFHWSLFVVFTFIQELLHENTNLLLWHSTRMLDAWTFIANIHFHLNVDLMYPNTPQSLLQLLHIWICFLETDVNYKVTNQLTNGITSCSPS